MLAAIEWVAWCVAIISGATLFAIESKIVYQPTHATVQFTRPIHTKGIVIYTTPDQERWNDIATWGFFGGIFVGAVAFSRRQPRDKL
jgi:uncharacterized membrane protein